MRPTQLQQRLAAPERACAHCARPSVAPRPPRSVARRAEQQPPGGQAGIAESSTQTAPGDVAAVAPEDLPLNASGPGVQPPNDSTYLEPFDFFKTALQLVTIQMVCGYAVTPALAAVAEELPLFGISVAPFLSQLLYIAAAGYVSRTALTRGGFSEPRGFFRYTSKPGLFAVGLAGTLLCVGVAVGIDNLDAVRAPSSTSTDLVQLLNGGAPLSMYFTGMTTGALTPWIEERVFRGFILQGLLPYVGAPGAVIASSAAFAGSHLSVQGFPQLFAFGCILGTAHVASQRNLLLPTLMHSSFNLFILAALLITSFPLGIAQGSP